MPRSRSLFVLRLTSVIAVGVSMALLLDSLRPQPAFCSTGSGCDQIRKLGLGKIAGIPVPAVGLASYSALFSLSMMPSARQLTGVAAVFGGFIGLCLLGAQAIFLNVFCKFCVVVDLSAIVCAVAGYFVMGIEGELDDRWRISWLGLLVAALGLPWGISSMIPPSQAPRTVRSLWKADHPVNVVEFSDFECPFCRINHPDLEAALHKAKDIKIHFVRKTMPLPSHPNARNASRAYLCADAAGKGDAMADKLFSNDLSLEAIAASARDLGLDAAAFDACLKDPATDARVDDHIAFVRGSEFRGLPTVWINNHLSLGARSEADYLKLFREAAAGSNGESGKPIPLLLVIASSLGLVAFGAASARRQTAA